MKVTFVSNYINHHQIPLSDVLYRNWGEDYCFIETQPMDEERVRLGWNPDSSSIPYVLQYAKNPESAQRIIMESDIVIFGGVDDESYIKERLKEGKIVLRYMERLYKEGQWKAISPRGLIKKYQDHTRYKNAPVYLLCAGGYVADDFNIIKAYKGKRFKWGYFPAFERSSAAERKTWKENNVIRILWAGRFIDWKHPESALITAEYLKSKGIEFKLTMAGGGDMEAELRHYVKEHNLEDCVEFPGFCSPEQVRNMMKQSHIYLFTSDYKEGWGVVLNEAMNSGCAVVASHAIGAVPFLLTHNKNGLVYQSGNHRELEELTELLCNDVKFREQIGDEAYKSIADKWNPEYAGNEFVRLCEELMREEICFRAEGPLSEAAVIKQRKMYKYLHQ